MAPLERDLARALRWRFHSSDGAAGGPYALEPQPRDRPSRGPLPLSRPAGRCRGLTQRTTTHKVCRLAQHPALARTVAAKLRLSWSPQQIAGWLERRFGNDESRRVSHETEDLQLSMERIKRNLTVHRSMFRSIWKLAPRDTFVSLGKEVPSIETAPLQLDCIDHNLRTLALRAILRPVS